MSLIGTITLGSVLSLIGVFLLIFQVEQGDVNTILTIFVISLLPILFVAISNAFFLQILRKAESKSLIRVISFFPVIILFFLALTGRLPLPILDLDFSYIASATFITIGITNIIWNLRLKKYQKRNAAT